MDPISPRITGIEHGVDEIKARLEKMSPRRDSSSSVTFSVNAGGFGVWVATTLCAVMFSLNIALGAMYLNLDRKLDRVEDYQNTIYALVPGLRQEVEKIINDRKKREQ
jgi:hypothetical protein